MPGDSNGVSARFPGGEITTRGLLGFVTLSLALFVGVASAGLWVSYDNAKRLESQIQATNDANIRAHRDGIAAMRGVVRSNDRLLCIFLTSPAERLQWGQYIKSRDDVAKICPWLREGDGPP